MSTAVAPTPPAITPAPPPLFAGVAPLRTFTVDEYHRMLAAGILIECETTELLSGYLVRKMPRGSPHDSTLDLLDQFFVPVLPADWYARSQRAVTFADSEPEPDFAVVRGPRLRYRQSHPHAADIALVVEVSDSSLRVDRHGKAAIYAEAGIAVYWIVNVVDRQIEVLTQPAGSGYTQRDVYPVGTVVPIVLDGAQVGAVAVADIMP